MRVSDMNEAGRLSICCVILHNLAIKHGDLGDEMADEDPEIPRQQPPNPAPEPAIDVGREGRRNHLMRSFI